MTRPPEGRAGCSSRSSTATACCAASKTATATVLTRRGNDWTERVPQHRRSGARLPCRAALIDGEAVVSTRAASRASSACRTRLKGDNSPIVLVAFDLLHLDGWDLRGAPLHRAQSAARAACSKARRRRIRYGEHVTEDGAKFFARRASSGSKASSRSARRDPYRERAHAQLAQDQVPEAPGARRRRLHGSRRLAHGVRRAARRDARRARTRRCATPARSARASTSAR